MKLLLSVLKDKNFKKYAIQIPQNINIINNIDRWSRETTLGIIKKNMLKIFKSFQFFYFLYFFNIFLQM